jgi:hypothetical protein
MDLPTPGGPWIDRVLVADVIADCITELGHCQLLPHDFRQQVRLEALAHSRHERIWAYKE